MVSEPGDQQNGQANLKSMATGSLPPAADQSELTEAYGHFRQEAQRVDSDYQPLTRTSRNQTRQTTYHEYHE